MYIQYASNPSAQREILTVEELIKKVNSSEEGYSSTYLYDEEMFEYFNKNNSVAGFPGKIYSKWFIFDIDGKTISSCMTALHNMLDEFHIQNMFYYLFFSGKKGFHLYIPINYFEYDKEIDFNIINRHLMNYFVRIFPELKDYLDPSIYSKVSLLRLPFSKHNNGKNKIPIL